MDPIGERLSLCAYLPVWGLRMRPSRSSSCLEALSGVSPWEPHSGVCHMESQDLSSHGTVQANGLGDGGWRWVTLCWIYTSCCTSAPVILINKAVACFHFSCVLWFICSLFLHPLLLGLQYQCNIL